MPVRSRAHVRWFVFVIATVVAFAGLALGVPGPAPARAIAALGPGLIRCPTTRTETAWACLERRPLHLPPVGSNGACPTSPLHGGVMGDGPVTIGLLTAPVWTFLPDGSHDGWSAQKAPWTVAPNRKGQPILVRGHQIGGPNRLRFALAEDFASGILIHPLRTELRMAPYPSGGDLIEPSLVWVRAAGCYAWQADGPDFSEVIVFEARYVAS